MDGFEAARTIRADRGEGERTRIIGFSAASETCLSGEAAGMDECLTKPVRLPDLMDDLSRLSDD